MRISPIFSQSNRPNSMAMGQAFQRVNCRKPMVQNSARDNHDVFMRLAEASMANTARGKQMEAELKSMGLI